MADQETRERDDAGSTDAPAEKDTDTETSEGSETSATSEKSETSEGSSGEGDSSDEGSSDSSTTATTSSGGSGSSPARRSENHAKPQAPSDSDREAQEANRRSFVGGSRSDEEAPAGQSRRASVDVGELVWKVANVLATVIRVVTLVFAVILVADIALVVVGVNPANGVASFVRGFADTVVLGFRDLFLPADPTIALVVNYGVAAVFWVVVGGFVSAGIRFLAARIN